MENRQQALYWKELVDLKVGCEYVRRYRDNLAATMTRFAVIRAVVSVSALGAWAAVKSCPMVWGGIIAAAQVADALQNAIPFAARFRTNALCSTFDALFIDCQMEWEDIFAGRLDEAEISKRRHKMMKLRHDADVKNLPNGLPARKSLLRLAEADAAAYFRNTFATEVQLT
jgi:hypothetical protein